MCLMPLSSWNISLIHRHPILSVSNKIGLFLGEIFSSLFCEEYFKLFYFQLNSNQLIFTPRACFIQKLDQVTDGLILNQG